MLRCKICNSADLILIDNFKPYLDIDWTFEIYDCLNCKVRFALRNKKINYYELLHSNKWGGYANHYKVADNVKQFLQSKNLKACKEYLMSIGGGTYKELIKYLAQKEKSARILELGCSSGFLSAYLKSEGYRVEGVDISKNAISYAQSTFGPFFNTQPKEKDYDIIIHKGLIGCVDDPKSFFSYYHALLKPGGEMFFNAPNVESLIKLKELWVSTPPPDLIYVYHQTTFDYLINENSEKQIFKLKTKREIIKKNIKKLQKKDYNCYPKQLKMGQFGNYERKKKNLKSILDKLVLFVASLLYPFPIIRKFDDEYGLIIRIKKL